MGNLVCASLGHTPQFSVSHNRGSKCNITQLWPEAWGTLYRHSGWGPTTQRILKFQHLPAINHSIPIGLGYRLITHVLPRGMKSPAVCREPLLQGREHGGEDEDEAVWPYTKPSSPTLTFCFLTFKNKEWCKYNSLLLEAGHWTDIVGPEVVYDWSQSFYPLLKEKEKAFLVSKTTGTENSGFHETACIHSV